MSITRYTYNKQVNIITLREEIEASTVIVIGIHNIVGTATIVHIDMKDALPQASEDDLIALVNAHVYTDPVEVEIHPSLTPSGRLIVHQTTRPVGSYIYYTGYGDSIADHTDIGNGNMIGIFHTTGEALSGIFDITFNVLGNDTRIYEGNIIWDGCEGDTICLDAVTNKTDIAILSGGTDLALANGVVIVPTSPGTGNVQITSDITLPWGGLIAMPLNDEGIRSAGYWDAEYDVVNNVFTNIVPNLAGTGVYNMFAAHVPLTRICNNVTLLKWGSQSFDSEDTFQLSHGLMLRFTYTTRGSDHNWSAALTLTMHREKTI